ncbi:MAG: hypothetical protein Q9M18_05715 [Mariprofundaceae bacterium]|nr:hypothetical protein [Mariprofundaceae bacterium]
MSTTIKHVWASTLVVFLLPYIAFADEKTNYGFGIESMRSQNYSIGILAFLFISMAVFVGVIRLFYQHTDMSQVKTGEKVLMGMIVMGVVVAGIFAVIQLLDGYLF